MHEIKFRAWDKEEKRMINFNEPIWKDDWEGNTYLKLSMDGLLCTAYWDKRKYDYYKERFELMQYTGLKDKNGKEIYEGDIVKRIRDIKEVRWGKEITGFSPFNDYDSDCQEYYETGECEIIGNRYENPELLK